MDTSSRKYLQLNTTYIDIFFPLRHTLMVIVRRLRRYMVDNKICAYVLVRGNRPAAVCRVIIINGRRPPSSRTHKKVVGKPTLPGFSVKQRR